MRKVERDHYDLLFRQNRNNLRKTWSVIKDVINKKTRSELVNSFMVNDEIITEKKAIADGFNDFFVNIGPNLAKQIPENNKDPLEYIRKDIANSMYMHDVEADEIKKVISSLNTGSPGWDDIHAKVLKSSFHLHIVPLLHIVNLSFTQGIFPNELKIARVVPIYKNGNNILFNNYRPVSVLPVFSKVFERLMYSRLLSFIQKHDILYKYQFGFREGHNTNMALIILVDKIMNALDNGEIVLGIFLDFSKAFDTVNIDILLRKLFKYGVRGVCLDWFKSYFSNRKQFVTFNNFNSTRKDIICGVPQGSILGPLLFLLYVNDMVNVSNILFSILFADDTNLFLTGKNLSATINNMNKELEKVVDWLSVNKLSLNIKKTNYMVFNTGKKCLTTDKNVSINGQLIAKVESTKFLGVIIDSKMTWSEHIQYIKGKISRSIGMLYKARKVFSSCTLNTLYYSLIYPYLTYCIEVWGKASNIYLSSIYKLQKRVVRIIVSAPYAAHTLPIFLKLKILPLEKIYIYRIILFMYKYVCGTFPNIFEAIFVSNWVVHRYPTRQIYKFHVPKARLSIFQKSIRFTGVFWWNYISDKLIYDCGIYTYKSKLKDFILHSDTTSQ
jgi:hypothetical protein